MFTLTHALETSATPERVWMLLEDPLRWAEWMGGLSMVRMASPPAPGARGQLEFKGHGRRRFRLEAIQGLTEIRWTVLGFGREARCRITIASAPMGTRITQRADVKGIGAWMDPLFRRSLLGVLIPEGTRALARLAARG